MVYEVANTSIDDRNPKILTISVLFAMSAALSCLAGYNMAQGRQDPVTAEVQGFLPMKSSFLYTNLDAMST